MKRRDPDTPNFAIPADVDQRKAALIMRRRLQLLVHSRIYYRLSTSLVDDQTFDRWSRELKELQDGDPRTAQAVPCFREAFSDWEGSTGMHLPLDHPFVSSKAAYLLQIGAKNNEQKINKVLQQPTGKSSSEITSRQKNPKQRSNTVSKGRRRVRKLFG